MQKSDKYRSKNTEFIVLRMFYNAHKCRISHKQVENSSLVLQKIKKQNYILKDQSFKVVQTIKNSEIKWRGKTRKNECGMYGYIF